MTKSVWGLLAGLATLLVALVAAPSQQSGLWQFLGRFHPTLVHLPIGILVVALVLELAGRFFRAKSVLGAVPLLLLLGAWSAIIAALAGTLLSNWGGYLPTTLMWHRIVALVVVVLAVVAYALRRQPTPPNGTAWYPTTAALLGVGLGVGGHLGGTLTHGEGYLTDNLAPSLRSLLGLPAQTHLGALPTGNLDSASAYQALIQPMLTQRCGNCHSPARKTGGLSVANLTDLLAGGRNGKVIVPGRSAESEVIRRIWLPPGHQDRMPPDRTIPIAEAELIKWWIDQGAPDELKLAEMERPTAVRRILGSYGLDDLATGVFTVKIPPADAAAIASAQRSGLRIAPIAGNSAFLSVATSGPFSAASFDALKPLATQVAWLDLAGTAADDSTVGRLTSLTHLARLSLQNTRVTDRGLEGIKDLGYLEYLNLYGTQVTDDGLPALHQLKRLRSLFLWGTKVTAGGADSLRRVLPRLDVNLGLDAASDSTTGR
ncbi:MAG: DUF2231 domain-containing protein [Gemmatimonadales bacterium]